MDKQINGEQSVKTLWIGIIFSVIVIAAIFFVSLYGFLTGKSFRGEQRSFTAQEKKEILSRLSEDSPASNITEDEKQEIISGLSEQSPGHVMSASEKLEILKNIE